jgi:Fe-S-cluster containining protein
MTLTESDRERLDAAGCSDYSFVNLDHDLQLKNKDGHCVFLVDGKCSVYEHRPGGCRTFPLVLDLDSDRVFLHHECPWSHEFRLPPDTEQRLRSSVEQEFRERKLRRND